MNFADFPRFDLVRRSIFLASDRNWDAPNAHIARKLTVDALRTIRMAVVLARAFPNWFLKTTKREERKREIKEKEGRKRKEKGRSGASKQPPSWPECSAF